MNHKRIIFNVSGGKERLTNLDINLDNFTFTEIELGQALIHFTGGDVVTVSVDTWNSMKDTWLKK